MLRAAPPLRSILALLAGLALSMSPALAAAQPRSASAEGEAKDRFGRGIDLYAQGDFGGALAEFKRAYDLAPYAVILYNLGLTYERLGRPVEASDTMQRVLESPGSLSAERVARARTVAAEQRARIAELTIVTSVPGAVIEVDGVEVAKTPLAKPLRVKGGPHRVGAVLSGFAPSRRELDVAAGAKETLRFELAPTDKRLGHLDVRANVGGATLYVDGLAVGETPLATTLAILPGAHDLEAKRIGYHTARRHVDVGEGSTGDVRFELEEDVNAARAEGGDLALSIEETQPVVFVDGKPQPSALGTLRLAPGPHRVRVERAGFFPVEREVDIPRRGHLDVRVSLEPTADFKASYEKKARFYRTGAYIGFIAGGAIAGGGVTMALYTKSRRDAHADAITQKQSSGECGGANPDVVACEEFSRIETAGFDRNQTLMIAGWIIAAAGGAAVGTGLTLLLVGDDPHRYDRGEKEKLGLRISPAFDAGPRGGTLGLRASF